MKPLYTIQDTVAEFFLPPFVAENDNQAKRMFIGSLGDNFPHRHDFVLFHVGDFNDDDGTLQLPSSIRVVLAGSSVAVTMDPRPRTITQQEQNQ